MIKKWMLVVMIMVMMTATGLEGWSCLDLALLEGNGILAKHKRDITSNEEGERKEEKIRG